MYILFFVRSTAANQAPPRLCTTLKRRRACPREKGAQLQQYAGRRLLSLTCFCSPPTAPTSWGLTTGN